METFHSLTKQSTNSKLGLGVSAHMSSDNTCPSSCALRNKSCYARFGKVGIWWRRLSKGERGTNWDDFVNSVKTLPTKFKLRLNVAGDLVPLKKGSKTIDRCSLEKLADAVKARQLDSWGYSHYDLSKKNVETLKLVAKKGLVINASADSIKEADEHFSKGVPTVVTVPSDFKSGTKSEAGNRIVICPQQTHNTTCAECMLCHKKDRKYIIAFKSHGCASKSLDERLNSEKL